MTVLETTRQAVAQRGKRLEYFTIAWNTLEGVVAIVAGATAGSISLVGFGIDSFIEVTSGATLLWRMHVDSDAKRRRFYEASFGADWADPLEYHLTVNTARLGAEAVDLVALAASRHWARP